VNAAGRPRVVRTTYAEETIARMKRLVLDGTWRPGDRLPNEEALCDQFQVGRSTVREAKRALLLLGAIEINKRRDGSVVSSTAKGLLAVHGISEFRQPSTEELYQIRRMLEGEIAALAAESADASDLEAMQRPLHQMERLYAAPDRFIAADVDFHAAMANATKNTILVGMYLHLRVIMTGILLEVANIPGVMTHSHECHKNTLHAIREHNGPEARRLTLDHLSFMADVISRHKQPSRKETA